jgi:four helix bundle protein
MRSAELKERSKQFALRVVRLFRALPRNTDAQVMGKQLLRSGTSVAANYRAACRARSRSEFVARIRIVAEEADEGVFWLEMLTESGSVKVERLDGLLKEGRELTAIFTAAQDTIRSLKRK